METAKVLNNGLNQVIQLPNEYKITSDEMIVHKVGNAIILLEKEDSWQTFLNGIDGFSDDFLNEGRELIEVNRESL